MKKTYPSDLSDKEWKLLAPLFPKKKDFGRPREHSYRSILNAIFYISKSGCAWRMMPNDMPAWQTVYHYFRRWRLSALWEQVHGILRALVRLKAKRNVKASAGVLDSQSVKTSVKGGYVATMEARKLRVEDVIYS